MKELERFRQFLNEEESNKINEGMSTLFFSIASVLIAIAANANRNSEGSSPLQIPFELYQNWKNKRKFKKILKRLASDPEIMAAAQNPNKKGWRNLIASKLTDEERGYIEGTAWVGGDFKTIYRRDINQFK